MTRRLIYPGKSSVNKPRLVSATRGTQNLVDFATITKPSNVVSGNLLLIVLGYPTWGAHSGAITGFTSVATAATNVFVDDIASMQVYRRRANGSEGASFVADLSGSALDCAWWCGNFDMFHASSNPEGNGTNGQNSTNPDTLDEPTSWGAADAGFLSAICYPSSAGLTGYPSNCGVGREEVAGASIDVSLGIAIGYGRNVSSFDPAAFTLSAAKDWCGITTAFRAE